MGAGIFSQGVISAQWLGDCGGLECGQTAGGVGMGGWPKAWNKDIRPLAKGPKAPGPPTAPSEQGPGVARRAGPPPNTSVLVPKASGFE